MKKLLSVVLSLVMVFAVGAGSVYAYAADSVTYNSQETTKSGYKDIKTQVNGKTSTDVTYDVDEKNPNKITFTYDGDGKLIGWEFVDMEEGVDYEIVSEDGNSITILVMDSYEGDVVANAIVEETTTKKETKKNNNNKSPKTGALSLGGLGVAAAGAAIAVALKKKNDEE